MTFKLGITAARRRVMKRLVDHPATEFLPIGGSHPLALCRCTRPRQARDKGLLPKRCHAPTLMGISADEWHLFRSREGRDSGLRTVSTGHLRDRGHCFSDRQRPLRWAPVRPLWIYRAINEPVRATPARGTKIEVGAQARSSKYSARSAKYSVRGTVSEACAEQPS
jgi:hypothetical protein